MKDLVSILLATYNAEKYIKKTLYSCLDQSYENIEILVVDDNSQDNTVKIIEEIQNGKNGDKIKLFKNKKNLGPYNNLNLLLQNAQGEYIAIQDHDDIWFPEKIKKQVELLKGDKELIACGTNTFYYHEAKKLFILNKKSFLTNFVDHTSLMFRNRGFKYDTDYLLTDEHFEKKVLAKKGDIACIQDILTVHRIKSDGTNLSNSRFKISLKSVKDFFVVNDFNFNTLSYLLYLIIGRYIPEKAVWFIRLNFTQIDSLKLDLNEFCLKYPEMKEYI